MPAASSIAAIVAAGRGEMDMICSLCGKTGIRWMGQLSNLTHTECPHCGGTNCQEPEPANEEPTP